MYIYLIYCFAVSSYHLVWLLLKIYLWSVIILPALSSMVSVGSCTAIQLSATGAIMIYLLDVKQIE